MSTTAHASTNPVDLERQANASREEVDRTLEAIENRFSVRRKIDAAREALGAAATRASKWTSPEITTMIRLDHTHVLAAFHRYRSYLSRARKRAVVANACLGLELHAQLEEEIFYPALFAQGSDAGELDQSIGEHDQMRSLIQRLRQMSPQDANYDGIFCELIRTALHHVADEETILLPLAEVRLKGQLRELGWKMTMRRFELLKPRMGEAATTTVMTFPVMTGAAIAGLCMAAWLLFRGTTRSA
jgi:Hemerythrin HHE cation binding domain